MKLYGRRWERARRMFLTYHPRCRMCEERGKLMRSEVVDHIVPHRGDVDLFWDEGNWQALCASCHNSDKQKFEKTGRIEGVRPDGTPIDANHHWYRDACGNDRDGGG